MGLVNHLCPALTQNGPNKQTGESFDLSFERGGGGSRGGGPPGVHDGADLEDSWCSMAVA